MSKGLGAYQHLARIVAKPYVSAEGPGWGYLYRTFVGHVERDWLWQGAPTIAVTDKTTGYVTRRDLSWWSDRLSYFLGRWYSLEPQLIAKAFIGKGDAVIDIGANRGDFSLCASMLVGQTGRVLAFEPNPTCVDLFRQTLSANRIGNVELFAMGLSDSNENLPLTIPTACSGEASFGTSRFDPKDVQTVNAPVRVGDNVLSDSRPAFIKIDVEGFEVRVLRGLQQTIESSSPVILTELVSDHLTRCGSSRAELIDLMISLGYVGYVAELTRNRRDWSAERLENRDGGDVLWVRDNSVAASKILRRLRR
jgi:FkbM family methyltransferase